ncbi:hypothetical protein B0H12DRAFT_1238825 [Mycena haematopus]|nr:hypothetical protein B0H12DRAFT_1238825 [Mycena haematopus]
MPPSTKDLLERARLRREERQNAPPIPSTPSSPGFPSTSGLQPMPPLFGLSSTPQLSNTLSVRGTSMTQLKNFGERELKRVKLGPSTESDFRTYLVTTNNKDERDTLQALWTLQVRDQLSKLTQDTAESWTPSSALEKASRRNIHSFLLLPNIQLYAGTLGDAILLAMRAANTPDLPNPDSVHVDELVTWLSEEISQARYAMKKKIIENARLNVAELAAELLSHAHSHHVPHTLGLYMRLALLRRHIGLNHNANAFWGKVDDEMEEFRGGGSEAFVDLMEGLYEDDIKDFGNPATTEYTIKSFTDPNFNCPQWLRELYRVAPQVKRLPKQKGRNKKRKRITTDSEDDTRDRVSNDGNQIPEGEPGQGEEEPSDGGSGAAREVVDES